MGHFNSSRKLTMQLTMQLTRANTFLLLVTLCMSGGKAMAADKTEENLQLLGKFAEQVFIKKNLSDLDHFMHPDYIQHNPFVEQGITGFSEFFSQWFTAIPDFSYKLKNIIANDEYVWVYGTYSGTHSHSWLGIDATHQSYAFDAVDIFRVENGKLAEHWDVLDLHTLFKQLHSE